MRPKQQYIVLNRKKKVFFKSVHGISCLLNPFSSPKKNNMAACHSAPICYLFCCGNNTLVGKGRERLLVFLCVFKTC